MEDIEVEPAQPSATQIEIESMALKGLQKAEIDTENLSSTILASMRLKQLDDGTIERLSDDEFIATLGETEQQNFRNFQTQVERMETALAGTGPVSEGLRQKKANDFRVFKENEARLGNDIIGDDLDTATSNSTSGKQALESFRNTYLLAEENERFNERLVGQANIGQNVGLISDLAGRQINAATAFPLRNLTAVNPFQNQAGLLSRESLMNAQTSAGSRSDLFGLASTIGGLGAYGYFSRP